MIDSEFKQFVYTELSQIGKAMSDPKRIELLDLLCQCPKNVETLAKAIKCSVAATSHNLQVLKQARMVKSEKDGKYIYYEATDFGKEIWKNTSDSCEKYLPQIKSSLHDFFNQDSEFEEVSHKELNSLIKQGKILLIDVRPPEEFEHSHIPGAISVPLRTINEKIKSFSTKKKVVAYCRGTYCVLSKNAVMQLKAKGFRAFRLKQSVLDWKN